MTTLDIRPESDARVAALRDAVAQLLGGYSEVAAILAQVDPETREALLAPLRRAADSAATVLATS